VHEPRDHDLHRPNPRRRVAVERLTESARTVD